MTEVKDLDVKTLEYVLSMVDEDYEATKEMYKYWKKEECGIVAHMYGLQSHRFFKLTEKIRDLIREQQEAE